MAGEGAGKKLWGWYPTTGTWVPLKVNANGKVIVDMSAINLNDLGDTNVPAPSDGYFLYWHDASSKWKDKAIILPSDILTTRGDIITRNATAPKRLALGTAGHYLKAGANEPEWAAVAAAAGEGHITILPFSYVSIGQGTWVLSFDAGKYLGGAFWNSSATDGDNVSYKVYLDAGTYTLLISGNTWPHAGITDIYLDAVEIASFDWYADPVVKNVRQLQTGITVASSGIYTLKIQLDGKHASSNGYQFLPSYIALWRTA